MTVMENENSHRSNPFFFKEKAARKNEKEIIPYL